jgi:oligopeptide/dipeptide ABC transporter ATP-binding protein
VLLSAVPHPDPDVKMNLNIRGEVADPARLPTGCAFHPRCPDKFEPCDKERPDLSPTTPARCAACHLYRPTR